jgi:chemotaxis protein MotB
MKQVMGSTGIGALGAMLLAIVSGACVAQEKYADSEVTAKHWQKEFFAADKQRAQLEAENARLKSQLEASNIDIANAGYTQEIDARLKNVRDILAQLGNAPDDVTKFQVDGGYVYRVKDSILFALGSSEISSDGQKVLVTLAEDINSRPHGPIYVRGHTDNVPVAKPETLQRFPHGNMQLSAARAVEVAAMLTEKCRVDGSRLVVMGFGPNEPVAGNDSEGSRQKNRRVDIFVADVESSSAKADQH